MFIFPKNILLIPAAVILVIATGATARSEKWRSIVSQAKLVPAIGAVNPAAIAPATPQPRKTSVVRSSLEYLLNVVHDLLFLFEFEALFQ